MKAREARKAKRPTKYLTQNAKVRLVSRALTVLGQLGGEARAAKLTPERRLEIAVKASKAAAIARAKRDSGTNVPASRM